MPTATLVSRFTSADYFPMLAPSLYALGTLAVTMTAWSPVPEEQTLWSRVERWAQAVGSNWVLAFVLLILIYVAANIFRAIPVGLADRLCGRRSSWFKKSTEFDKRLYQSEFPYRAMLEYTRDQLQWTYGESPHQLPDGDNAHTIFNRWKTVLLLSNPDAFAHAQSLEARVRLFCGMIWASGLGGVFGTILLLRLLWLFKRTPVPPHQWGTALAICVISALCGYLCAWRLRPARGEEVHQVHLAVILLEERQAAAAEEAQEVH